jgi:hypothetical protein
VGKLSAENAQRLVTHNIIPRHYLATVLERALATGEEGSPSQRRLRRMVSHSVTVPGYDSPWDAPEEICREAILDAAMASGPLLRAVLRAWARSLPALRGRVADYLEEDAGPGEGVSTSDWTPDTMRAAVAAIRQETPGLAHNDVALMLCWLADYVPVLEDLAPGERLPGQAPRAEDEGPYRPRWEPLPEQTLPVPWADGVQHWQIIFREVLEGLRQLAADSAVWTAVNHFAESLRALIDEKARERATARAQLQEALDALLREADEDVAFFGLQDIPRWRPERAPLERIPALIDSIADLQRSLGRHHALRQMTAATVNEQLLQRMRLQSLESRVYETYARLASLLGARATEAQTIEPEPAGAQPPQAPSAAPSLTITEAARSAEDRPATRAEAPREGGSGAPAETAPSPGVLADEVAPARQVAEEGALAVAPPLAESSAPSPSVAPATPGIVETVDSAGEALVGEALVGEALVGEALVGEALAGEALASEALASEALVGEALAGEALASEALAGEALASEALAGEALVGEALAGEALVGEQPAAEMAPEAEVTPAPEPANVEEGEPEPRVASAVAPAPESASEAAEAVGALAAEEAAPEGDLTSGSAPLAAATPVADAGGTPAAAPLAERPAAPPVTASETAPAAQPDAPSAETYAATAPAPPQAPGEEGDEAASWFTDLAQWEPLPRGRRGAASSGASAARARGGLGGFLSRIWQAVTGRRASR